MKNLIYLSVVFPKNRNLNGHMDVYFDGVFKKRFLALGRGSRGTGDTQFLRYGNTPTGSYDGSTVVERHSFSRDSYGQNGLIRLQPIAGNALVAKDIFNRSGLLIHGGSLGAEHYWRGAGELRATRGCIRLHDDDMKYLIHLITETTLADDTACLVKPYEVRVDVSEG